MDRKLIVTLLKKHIQELEMITEGFMEMTIYPKPIITLAQKKTEDILEYIFQLKELKPETALTDPKNNDTPLLSDNTAQVAVDEMEESVIVVETTTKIVEEIFTIYQEAEIEATILNEEKIELDKNKEEKLDFKEDKDKFEENEEKNDKNLDEELNTIENDIVENEIEESLEVQIEDIVSAEIITTVKEEKFTIHAIEVEKNTIGESHNNKKIDDIRQAISIGDRFRFQRELFNGNGEVLNKTLSYLNQLSDFEEAHTYLKNKFKWNEEDETVESFYQIIRRRYL